MAKLEDIIDSSWSRICAMLRRDKHPSIPQLAAALRRGEAVPAQAQAYLADLLERRLDRRGRPEAPKKKWSGIKLVFLQMQMDEFVYRETFEAGEEANAAAEKALRELAPRYHVAVDTLKRYLAKAAKLMAIHDAALAIEVNTERERLEPEGAADALHSALELTAKKRQLPIWSVKARYERGKQYVLEHVEYGPEFK